MSETFYLPVVLLIGVIVATSLVLEHSLFNAISEINNKISTIDNNLTIINDRISNLNRSFEIVTANPIFVDLPNLSSNPSFYEGKLVAVAGEIHHLVNLPEIRLPFNALVTSKGQSFGVLTSFSFIEGDKVVVKGVIARGFQERLTENEWMKDKEIYYIAALEVEGV